MLLPFSLFRRGFAVVLVLVASSAACKTGPRVAGSPGTGGSGGDSSASGITLTTGSSSGAPTTGPFDVEPSTLQTIAVTAGQNVPTLAYTATLGGKPTNAVWGLDKGNVGAVGPTPSSQVVFTPTGTTGGLVTITASASGRSAQRQVMVQLTGHQNGPNASAGEMAQIPKTVADLTAGGGVGGVGGEGLGTAVSDPATIAALGSPTGNGQAQGLVFLYPYDKTVWPRGILAPLLQWGWSVGDADAVQIRLSTASKSFSWTGTFGRPPILAQTGGKFIRHPIPQDVWQMATDTAGGTSDQLTVELTVAKGGHGYGPIAETWTIASARLSGIIYYNSYGTQLAKNYSGAVGGDGTFGAAVLSIHVGDTGPKLVAGSSGGAAQCRTCHSVAANGARLVVQHGDDYQASSAYDLSANGPAVEHVLANGSAFPGVSPDGSMALTEGGQILPLPADPAPVDPTGLDQVASDLGTPSFSPGGDLVVFNSVDSGVIPNIMQKLYVMRFDKTTSAFSNPVLVVDDTGQPPETRPGWAAFLPDSKSVVFHHQTKASADGNVFAAFYTRSGARAQIHWTNVEDAQHVTALDRLNGKDGMGNVYLPKLATGKTMSCLADSTQVGDIAADHSDDVNMSYEPTVSPVGAGGYAWVVFTSRRMYGSVADIPPFCSDPRGVDLVQNVTTKKLWVAAIDLGAAPGADASHPAFYLPAQELLACNSRGFWVLDPCRADGASCASGDQCCNGYCEPNGPMSALVCSHTTPSSTCAGPMERCAVDADCCDPSNRCINGFCTQVGVAK
jgi:hypothetical protein